jgi:hypothetical protein
MLLYKKLPYNRNVARWQVLIVVFGLAISNSAAAKRHAIQNIVDAPIPKGLTLLQIKKALIVAGSQRNWVMREVEPGKLEATLLLRSHMAKVLVSYDTSSYAISYLDSKNLKHKNGKIHRNYNSWVQNLSNDIQRNLLLI